MDEFKKARPVIQAIGSKNMESHTVRTNSPLRTLSSVRLMYVAQVPPETVKNSDLMCMDELFKNILQFDVDQLKTQKSAFAPTQNSRREDVIFSTGSH